MVVQPGIGVGDILAETQHDALLLGLNTVEAGQSPDRQHAEQQQRHTEAAEMPARQQLLQPVLTTAQKILEIGRPRPNGLRPGAPGAFRTRAPGASALILPRHRQSPPRDVRGAPPGTICRLYRGRPWRLQRGLWLDAAKPDAAIVNVNIV